MTVFAVLLPQPAPGVVAQIKNLFPADHYEVAANQFLISSSGSAVELVKKLGVYDANNPAATTGNAVVLAVSSYYGRAPSTLWDWMKVKLEKSSG
jgi:hypothetical protein